jgi:hypothetical protein
MASSNCGRSSLVRKRETIWQSYASAASVGHGPWVMGHKQASSLRSRPEHAAHITHARTCDGARRMTQRHILHAFRSADVNVQAAKGCGGALTCKLWRRNSSASHSALGAASSAEITAAVADAPDVVVPTSASLPRRGSPSAFVAGAFLFAPSLSGFFGGDFGGDCGLTVPCALLLILRRLIASKSVGIRLLRARLQPSGLGPADALATGWRSGAVCV